MKMYRTPLLITLCLLLVFAASQIAAQYELQNWVLLITLCIPIAIWLVFHVVTAVMYLRHSPVVSRAAIKSDYIEPKLAVLIPARNEPFEVVCMTIDSIINNDYPLDKLQIVLVDNSAEDNLDKDLIAQHITALSNNEAYKGVAFSFIHREGTEGFKPKNIDIGLSAIDADYVLFLDVDSTMANNTLRQLVYEIDVLSDKDTAFLQTRAVPCNCHGHFRVADVHGVLSEYQRYIQGICMVWGHALFYGHNAIWRKQVLDEIGDCLEFTAYGHVVLAEDMSMSLRAKKLGYKGKPSWIASGEWVPNSLDETNAMWTRWTVGTLQVLSEFIRQKNPLSSFTLLEKIGWFYHIFSYFLYGITPLLFLFALFNENNTLLAVSLTGFIGQWLTFGVVTLKQIWQNRTDQHSNSSLPHSRTGTLWTTLSRHYQSFFLLESFIHWTKLKSLLKYAITKHSNWKPTHKGVEKQLQTRRHSQYLDIYLYNALLAGIILRYLLDPASVLIDGLLLIALLNPINALFAMLIFRRYSSATPLSEIVKYGGVDHYRGARDGR